MVDPREFRSAKKEHDKQVSDLDERVETLEAEVKSLKSELAKVVKFVVEHQRLLAKDRITGERRQLIAALDGKVRAKR